jgi:hypothetical protein
MSNEYQKFQSQSLYKLTYNVGMKMLVVQTQEQKQKQKVKLSTPLPDSIGAYYKNELLWGFKSY